MKRLVLVSGWPASGKSTLAGELAARLGSPLLAKDRLKETLFDTLGAGTPAWSRQLSEAAYALLWPLAGELLRTGTGVILEGNFEPDRHSAALHELIAHSPLPALELHCTAPPALLIRRFSARRRHPGHDDAAALHDYGRRCTEETQRPLAFTRSRLTVDTSLPLDWNALLAACVSGSPDLPVIEP